MTFLEKAMEINRINGKVKTRTQILETMCPYEYGLEDEQNCKKTKPSDCQKCWNREMPNTKPHFENPVIEKAYNTGLNDAWELAKKLYEMKFVETRKIFDGHERLEDIFDNFTPQEALAKLKAYEEAQEIKVGDVVKVNGRAIVVNAIRLDCILGLDRTGEFYEVEIDKCEKTGKHLDLASILEQIGE